MKVTKHHILWHFSHVRRLGNVGNYTHRLLLVLTMNVEVERNPETMICAQLEDSSSSEVNEGNQTSHFVALFSCQRWKRLGNMGNFTHCLLLVLTMNVEVERNTETMI